MNFHSGKCLRKHADLQLKSQPSVIVRRVTRQLLKGLIMELKLKTIWMMRLKLRAEGNKLMADGYKLRAEGNKLRAEGDKLRAEGNKLRAEGNKLRADGYKLRAEGNKLRAEGDKLWADGYKLWAEGDKLRAEGDKLWAEGILENYGNIKIEWKYKKDVFGCELENGDFYGEDMEI